MEFSEKLKKMRLEKGISQQKLADMIFVSRSAVAKWENGLGLPSEESYEALAKAFGVSKEYFTAEEPEQVIVEKNWKIKKISVSLSAIIAVVVIVLVVYGLFRPVPYYATATCETIEVQLSGYGNLEITDEDAVEELIDMLNATTFQRSFRVDAGESFPPEMKALLIMRGGKEQDSVILSATPHSASVYLIHDNVELRAIDPEILSDYLIQLLENETAGAWSVSS